MDPLEAGHVLQLGAKLASTLYLQVTNILTDNKVLANAATSGFVLRNPAISASDQPLRH